jgi:hypothetical protein
MAMNARESENYLAISRSSSASKSVEIFGQRYIGDNFFLGPNLVSFNRKLRTVFVSLPNMVHPLDTKSQK